MIKGTNKLGIRSDGAEIGALLHHETPERFDGTLTGDLGIAGFDPRKTGLTVMACSVEFFDTIRLPDELTRTPADLERQQRAERAPPNQGLAGLLAEKRPVMSVDMRGQIIRGSRVESGSPHEFTIDKYMEDFEAIRKQQGSDQLAILAYSPGGFFATHYAIRYPERVSALILVEPAVYTERDDLTQRARLAEGGDGVKAMEAMLSYIDPTLDAKTRYAMAVAIVADWQSSEIIARVFQLHAKALITDDMLEPLRRVPTLLIGGTASAMQFHVKRIAASVPEASTWWIKGADHLTMMSESSCRQIADIVDRFLSTR